MGECADREWDNEKDSFLLCPDLSVLDAVYLTFSRRSSMMMPLFISGFPHLLFTGVSARFFVRIMHEKTETAGAKMSS